MIHVRVNSKETLVDLANVVLEIGRERLTYSTNGTSPKNCITGTRRRELMNLSSGEQIADFGEFRFPYRLGKLYSGEVRFPCKYDKLYFVQVRVPLKFIDKHNSKNLRVFRSYPQCSRCIVCGACV